MEKRLILSLTTLDKPIFKRSRGGDYINRKEAIEKAKKAKEHGGVGNKSCEMSNLRNDGLYKTLDRLRKIVDLIK